MTRKDGFYSSTFNKSLAILPLITAAILLAMQSNLVISLGMVGALSIVRFRNAVKCPMDLVYLFWSISVGIIVGSGLYELAIIASLAVAALNVLIDLIPTFRPPYLLIVSTEKDKDDNEVIKCVKKHCRNMKVRNRNLTKNTKEFIIEVKTKNDSVLTKELVQLDGILSVNMLSHDGELRF